MKKSTMVKKFLILFIISIFIIGIYYIWCSYNPFIYIHINDGPTGKSGIKIEAPHIAYTKNGIAEPATSIISNMDALVLQHEEFCDYIKNHYQTSNIRLNIEIENDHMILSYYGSVTTINGETSEFRKDIYCDFVLNAKIENDE